MKQFKETNAIGNKKISLYSSITDSDIVRFTRSTVLKNVKERPSDLKEAEDPQPESLQVTEDLAAFKN